MTLCQNSDFSKERPLEFPDEPNRYQLFFIDEDESEHAPEYDMGPRNPDEPIGEFPALAFVLNKKFKNKTGGGPSAPDDQNTIEFQEQELRKKYEAEGKKMLSVVCNLTVLKSQTRSVVMENTDRIGKVFSLILKGNYNVKRFVILSLDG